MVDFKVLLQYGMTLEMYLQPFKKFYEEPITDTERKALLDHHPRYATLFRDAGSAKILRDDLFRHSDINMMLFPIVKSVFGTDGKKTWAIYWEQVPKKDFAKTYLFD
jgi:hypothetical protein